jgi:hypothetical protein
MAITGCRLSMNQSCKPIDQPSTTRWKQQEEKNDARSVHWNPGLSPGFFLCAEHDRQL